MAKRKTKSVRNSLGNRVALKKGECLRSDGILVYRYTDSDGKRKTISASTIELLREKENLLDTERVFSISSSGSIKTLDVVFNEWHELKRGIREHTMTNYCWLYNQYVKNGFGKNKVKEITPACIRKFYNNLYDVKNLSLRTVDGLHTVLGQIFKYAYEQRYIDRNPCEGAIVDLKKAHNDGEQKHKALSIEEQKRLLEFLESSDVYKHWYPVFAVMVGTGMRVGEITGLRWCDIDMDGDGTVDVSHTLIYYKSTEDGKMKFQINPPKSLSGKRTITMLGFVKDAFERQRLYQEENKIKCNVIVDGYTDFIFLNRYGNNQHQGTLNKALRTIIRDANYDALERNDGTVLIPKISCHNLRATFCTRLAEAGVSLKVAMKLMGHGDSRTTMEVYTTVCKDWEERELKPVNELLNINFG